MKKPAPQSGSARRRLRRIAGLMLALALIAGGGAHWVRQARITQIRTALPPLPASVPNETLRDLLTRAQTEAAATGRPSALAELGRLLHANGFPSEAEICWRLLVHLQPDEARWHYYLADIHRTTGDYAAAEVRWQSTVAADPGTAIAWLQLAELKFKTGRYAEAEHDYRRRLTLLPDDPYAELGLARLAPLQGRPTDTLPRLERILEKHPKFSAAHNLYAELQAAAGKEELADLHRWLGRGAGRFREADDPWMAELNARCHDPDRLCHLGIIAYQTSQGDRGRAQFEQAITLAPDDPLAYQLLGTLLLEEGAVGRAREVLSDGLLRAVKAIPEPLHYLKLSEADHTLNRPELARQALADGLRRHPDSPELLHAHGNRLKADGRIAEAAAAYRRALELSPSFVEADFALAILLLETGRREEAVQALQHALSMQPTFPKALLLLARLKIDAGRFEEAGRHLLPLLKANPGAPEIRQIVTGWRLRSARAVERTDPAAAEAHYRAGLSLTPEHPELNAGLGQQLLMTERVPESVPYLEAWFRAQSGSPEAALFLGQAYARTDRMSEARQVLTAGLRDAEQAGQTGTAARFREILAMLPR